MSESDWLTERFERHRFQLHSVAYRILGPAPDAEDAVQETWLRASRHTGEEIENPPAWLTTIVARVSLSMLRARAARPETLTPSDDPNEPVAAVLPLRTPEEQAVAESVGPAMLVVPRAVAGLS
ncbi:MAG: sigma factor [Tetrasphaera sp.]